MKKIEILNTITGKTFGTELSDIEASKWIAKMEQKAISGHGWGYGPRELFKKGQGHPEEVDYDQSLFLEEFNLPKDENGNVWTKVKLKAEYNITVTDITAEIAAKDQAEGDRKTEIGQIKTAINLINDDVDLKPYLKKILKRLVTELRE